MNTESGEGSKTIDGESVAGYLLDHPEYFLARPDLLLKLKVLHPCGAAVSLIERQVAVLRGRCGMLEGRLRDLISVAHDNEQLHQRLNRLIQDVISAGNLSGIVERVQSSLVGNFNADEVRILLVPEVADAGLTPRRKKRKSSKRPDVDVGPAAIEGVSFVDELQLGDFADLFHAGETVCGLPDEVQRARLAIDADASIGSMALIPLSGDRPLGLIMLCSSDPARFEAGKGVMFLNQLGEVLSRRLTTLESRAS